jgi:hypothetical protein
MGHNKQTIINHTNNKRNSKNVTLKSMTKYVCTCSWQNIYVKEVSGMRFTFNDRLGGGGGGGGGGGERERGDVMCDSSSLVC